MNSLRLDHIRFDCRHFRSDVPCSPHKEHHVHCREDDGSTCRFFAPVKKRILIIKLGAIGDVIRTTPLLHALRHANPDAEMWWLTHSPEVVRTSADIVLTFTPSSIITLQSTPFDVIYNLDKDKEACALANLVTAREKHGFVLHNGKCVPADALAEHKYLTGLFDDVSRANAKSYQDEVFEMCGFRFAGEEYIMPPVDETEWHLPKGKIVVGLNTGCGGRWTSRLWPEQYWISLAKKLKRKGIVPLLLGGEQEHKKNRRIAKVSGAKYLGHFPLPTFMSEVKRCNLVVTAVTMAMHLAIGYRRKIVLFNNIFNKHEFELYGRGEILEPDFDCTCFYSPTCPNNCMQYLSVERVYASCLRLLES